MINRSTGFYGISSDRRCSSRTLSSRASNELHSVTQRKCQSMRDHTKFPHRPKWQWQREGHEHRSPKAKKCVTLLCEMFSQAPLGRQSRPKWFMRGNKACQLFVLDKCYTKQKLTNLMMAKQRKMKVFGSEEKEKKKQGAWFSRAAHCHFRSGLKFKPAGLRKPWHRRGLASVPVEYMEKKVAFQRKLLGVQSQVKQIPAAGRAYLLQQAPCVPAPTPGPPPAHRTRTPGSPHQTSPPPAPPANTLSPSAQPAQALLSDASHHCAVLYCAVLCCTVL